MKIVPQSVQLIDSMGSDLSVVNAARVSFHKFHDVFEEGKDDKLVKYLATHNHWSPFAHAFLSFRIKAPIFVARQLVKHQVGLAWNEVSRRYVDDEPEFFWPEVWRGRPTDGAKQGSAGVADYMDELQWNGEDNLQSADERVENLVLGHVRHLVHWYNDLVANGVAPEQARMVLPQNTMTEWIWSGSLMAFSRVCKLRLDSHAQKETQEIAMQIFENVPEKFEHSWQALLESV